MVGKLSQRAMDSDYLDTTSVVVLYINTVYLSEIFAYCFRSRLCFYVQKRTHNYSNVTDAINT